MNPYRRSDYPVDILVRGHENMSLTYACLRSIQDNTPAEQFHLTYVDNGTSLGNFQHLLKNFPDVQFVRLPFNHGSVRAINAGLALSLLSPSEYVLLLDNDTEIPQGDHEWLTRFMSYFADEQVGAAGAVSDYVSGVQQAEVAPDTYTKDWQEEDGRGGVKQPPSVPLLVSFAMMIRKSALHDVGLFDERYEPGNCEDYDHVLRLRQAGYKAVVAKSVWIHHRGSQTFGRMNFPQLLQTNYSKLIDKWTVEELAAMGIQVKEAAT